MLNWQNAGRALQREEPKATETILVVDDEEPNRRQLAAMLSRQYRVITAQDGREALDQLNLPEIAAIVSDQRMPGMSGIDLFMQAERRHHPAVRIILTGFADLKSVIDAINHARVFRYLTKPIQEEELLLAVNNAVQYYKLSQTNLRLISTVKDLMEQNALMAKQLGNLPQESDRTGFATMPQAQKIPLTVMIADLCGLGKAASDAAPDKVMEALRIIYGSIFGMIQEAGGTVDRHAGACLMGIFGLGPDPGGLSGVRCMKRIIDTYPSLMSEVTRLLGNPLRLSMGLAAGEVVVGMLSAAERTEMALVGEPVDLAFRLQELTELMLRNPKQKDGFGEFRYVVGICLPELAQGVAGFRTVELSGQLMIRNFEGIRKVSVISD